MPTATIDRLILSAAFGLVVAAHAVGARGAEVVEPQVMNEGGIGGTGYEFDEGGIGGTGVIGVIGDAGGIRVSGFPVTTDAATEIERAGTAQGLASLVEGQFVHVTARSNGDQLRASHVHMLDAVVGPIERIDEDERRLLVLGQRVRVPETLWLKTSAAFAPGTAVRVSGLRRSNGDLLAHRIELVEKPAQFLVYGPVTHNEDGAIHVHGLRINVRDVSKDTIGVGREVEVAGVLEDGTLRAVWLNQLPRIPFGGKLRHVIIEGYLQNVEAERIWIGSTPVELREGTRLTGHVTGELVPDLHVIVHARVEDRVTLYAERIDILPPD